MMNAIARIVDMENPHGAFLCALTKTNPARIIGYYRYPSFIGDHHEMLRRGSLSFRRSDGSTSGSAGKVAGLP
jgi:hypothetical protein